MRLAAVHLVTMSLEVGRGRIRIDGVDAHAVDGLGTRAAASFGAAAASHVRLLEIIILLSLWCLPWLPG